VDLLGGEGVERVPLQLRAVLAQQHKVRVVAA
jgi:hypothetical protein